MAEGFTMAQLKELLDIHEKTIIKIFTNRIENLESKITSMQEDNTHESRIIVAPPDC